MKTLIIIIVLLLASVVHGHAQWITGQPPIEPLAGFAWPIPSQCDLSKATGLAKILREPQSLNPANEVLRTRYLNECAATYQQMVAQRQQLVEQLRKADEHIGQIAAFFTTLDPSTQTDMPAECKPYSSFQSQMTEGAWRLAHENVTRDQCEQAVPKVIAQRT